MTPIRASWTGARHGDSSIELVRAAVTLPVPGPEAADRPFGEVMLVRLSFTSRVEGHAAEEIMLSGIFDADRPQALMLYATKSPKLAGSRSATAPPLVGAEPSLRSQRRTRPARV
jgi:hypothetical protein